MRIGSSARLLASSLALATALETQPVLLRIDQEQYPDQTHKAECDVCCPTVIRTVLSTIISTVFQDRTQYVTPTQHDVSTSLQYITQFVTTTATKTYASSYPVTVTKTVGCDSHIYGRSHPSDTDGDHAGFQRLKGRTHDDCHTTTVTEWATATQTKLVTGIESVTITQTLPMTEPVPTTIHDTKTVVGSTTIWVPTTYVRNTTVISEHPVTRTVDNTIYTTKSTTVYTTMVSTVATSYPVVSYITKSLTQTVTAPGQLTTIIRPAETITKSGQIVTEPAQTITKTAQAITKPGETVTLPAQASTVTLPAQVSTVTLPAQVSTVTLPAQVSTETLSAQTQTVPGSTLISTLTRTLPPTIVTVTQGQLTKTILQPGITVTERQTQTLPPSLITGPAKTITPTPGFNVTLCPTPTGSTAPLSPTSDLTFGCKPGLVCNPPKPNGCNLWPGPPGDDFLCDANDCIPSPPLTTTTWNQCETHYYPPSYGYFNLDPEAFGLSYDIFEYQSHQEVADGHTTTVTTGNWESQSSLTAWPKPTDVSKPYYRAIRRRAKTVDELRDYRNKRDITPASCFDECNNAYLIASAEGKTAKLCAEGSAFQSAYRLCTTCITLNTNATAKTIGDYVEPQFAQFLVYCSGKKAGKPTTTPDKLQSMVDLPAVSEGTSSQAETSESGFTPVKPTTTATSEEAALSTTSSSTHLTTSASASASASMSASTFSALPLPLPLSPYSSSSYFTPNTAATSGPRESSAQSSNASPADGHRPTSPASSAQSSSASSADGHRPTSPADNPIHATSTPGQSSEKATSAVPTSTTDHVDIESQGGASSPNQASPTTAAPSATKSAKGIGKTKDANSNIAASPSNTTEPTNTHSAITAAANRILAPGALPPPALYAALASLMFML